ncbi:MAG TPA: hypothetical protein PLB59_05810 [Bacteroidales bacterium]|jgi:uncharacterized membrane protein YdjX (TVP38/TMEM64 family)|nr:hypothetical protein [Bacteroidales bacterium]HNZ41796.1 hypothetical protein [Bacteroidales bacterium]HPB24392.1 hypothetical protein [Bacteroidales bacterium]HPI29300.1 hypothetical protein [Bacteroidales bacterium]HQN15003.1 hypothetical protein [Bacteroidales bacterium]
MRISWEKCKKKLAILWFAGAGFIFFIMLLQTILGRYAENADQAWSWFLPTIIPTLSLIIGVLAMDSMSAEKDKHTVKKFFFKLSYFLSLAYFIVLSTTLLMQPFSPVSYLDLMKMSNLWLTPLQGLVGAALGAFFIQKEKS